MGIKEVWQVAFVLSIEKQVKLKFSFEYDFSFIGGGFYFLQEIIFSCCELSLVLVWEARFYFGVDILKWGVYSFE